MRKRRVGDPDAELRALKTGRDRPNLDLGEVRPKDLVMRFLYVENLRDRFEKKPRPVLLDARRQMGAVVAHAGHVLHDPVGFLPAKGPDQPRILPAYPVRDSRKVKGHDRYIERLEPRPELHRFAGPNDTVGPGNDERTAFPRFAEDLIDQVAGGDRQLSTLENPEDGSQSQRVES